MNGPWEKEIASSINNCGGRGGAFLTGRARIQKVFESVASHYDVMNDLMSFGLHRGWKRDFVRHLPLKNGDCILDVAGGTGDIPDYIRVLHPQKSFKICILDPSLKMLCEGRERSLNRGKVDSNLLCSGVAELLPFPDASVDVYTISFGLRNVSDRLKALQEAYRVLKPGGFLCCLEFSPVPRKGFRKIYKTYSQHVIPFLGQQVSGDREAYQYLVDSIEGFPPSETVCSMMESVNFKLHRMDSYGLGICVAYQGQKTIPIQDWKGLT